MVNKLLGTQVDRDRACLRTFVLFHGVLCYLFLRNAWWALLLVILVEALHSLFLWMIWRDRRWMLWVDAAISVVASFAAVFVFVTAEWVFNGTVFIGNNQTRILLLVFTFIVLVIGRSLLLFMRRDASAITAFVMILVVVAFMIGLLTNQAFYADAHSVTIAAVYCVVVLVTVTLPALGLGLFSYLIGAAVAIVVLSVSHDKHSPRPYSYYVSH